MNDSKLRLPNITYHSDQKMPKLLNESCSIRNQSVHGNQMLPKKVKGTAQFIQQLEELVADFDK